MADNRWMHMGNWLCCMSYELSLSLFVIPLCSRPILGPVLRLSHRPMILVHVRPLLCKCTGHALSLCDALSLPLLSLSLSLPLPLSPHPNASKRAITAFPAFLLLIPPIDSFQ